MRDLSTQTLNLTMKNNLFHLELLLQSVNVSKKSKILLVGAVRVRIMKKVPDATATKIRSNDEH